MKTNKGFTLIEIIITIVVMAIAAAMMTAIFSKQFRGGALSANQVQSQYRLIQQMELITSQYRKQITNNTFTLIDFENYVKSNTYVDSAKTDKATTFTYGKKTSQPCLRVTLTDGDQSLMTIFTQ